MPHGSAGRGGDEGSLLCLCFTFSSLAFPIHYITLTIMASTFRTTGRKIIAYVTLKRRALHCTHRDIVLAATMRTMPKNWAMPFPQNRSSFSSPPRPFWTMRVLWRFPGGWTATLKVCPVHMKEHASYASRSGARCCSGKDRARYSCIRGRFVYRRVWYV